jgi:ribosomal protein S18 acetylase RimI-like enzyme
MIRVLQESDAFDLRELRLRALRDAPDAFGSTYEAEASEPVDVTVGRLRQNPTAKDISVLGAFEDGILVGMLGVVRQTLRKSAHRATLWGTYVAPETRGRGVGRALIDEAVTRLKAAGVEQAHLTVATTAVAARRLYLRAGFVVVGSLREAMKDGNRYIDEELMELRLH